MEKKKQFLINAAGGGVLDGTHHGGL